MKRLLVRISFSRLLGISLVAVLTLPAAAQQPGPNVAPPPRLDATKRVGIERPAQDVLAKTLRDQLKLLNSRSDWAGETAVHAVIGTALRVNPARLDAVKTSAVQAPAVDLVANSAPAPAVASPLKPDATANPTVKPGDVKWHPSYAAACAAAKNSFKPVLLLHMMGQLDKQFC